MSADKKDISMQEALKQYNQRQINEVAVFLHSCCGDQVAMVEAVAAKFKMSLKTAAGLVRAFNLYII